MVVRKIVKGHSGLHYGTLRPQAGIAEPIFIARRPHGGRNPLRFFREASPTMPERHAR